MRNKKAQYIVVLITCPSQKEAIKIKDVLLKAKKAACINIIPRVDSFFWWKGKIDSCQEVLLIAKTRKDVFRKVVKLVKKNHKYTVPEIIALPIIAGNKDYLDWINKTVK
ncbi:MAG: divalent-cation tolerance protein CutA [bacterium]